jgi:AcrR family transcriptional regulator
MREAILLAACRAIVDRGVERVRMQDIAQAAGVSPTLPHYYFRTRSELLRQAFVHAEQGMVQLELEVAGEHPPRERLERLLLVYFDADPRVYEIWMLAREMTTRAIREPALRDSHEDA